MKALAKIIDLIYFLISQYRKNKFEDEIQEIKDSPSDGWAKRFGRVSDDAKDSAKSELPSSDTESSKDSK